MSQKALKPLLHPTHFFEVQRDRLRDIRNFYIPNELGLQILKTFVVVVVRIWETGYKVLSAASVGNECHKHTLIHRVREDALRPTVSRPA
jgi:hypothetical protein